MIAKAFIFYNTTIPHLIIIIIYLFTINRNINNKNRKNKLSLIK